MPTPNDFRLADVTTVIYVKNKRTLYVVARTEGRGYANGRLDHVN